MDKTIYPKVLFLSHMYPSSIDKIQGIFIHQYVKCIKESGVNLEIISPVPWAPKILWLKEKWKSYGSFPREEVFNAVKLARPRYIELPFRSFRSYSGPSMFICLYNFFKNLYKTYKFNVIHAHTITPDGHAALYLKKFFNVPLICSIRGSDLNEYPYSSKKIFKASIKVLKGSDAIIAVSKDLANKATEIANIKNPPYVIYNGVNYNIFRNFNNKLKIRKKLGIEPKSKIICFIGRCEREKGVFDLIKAFEIINREINNAYLLLIGDGKDKSIVINIIEKKALSKKVIIKSNIIHDAIPDYLNASDVFVLPSYSEGMPNVILEALACELPVVATNVGGIPEVISYNNAELLCSPGDYTSLAKIIIKIILNYDYYLIKANRARQNMVRRFSWEKGAKKTLFVYKKVLDSYET